MRHFDSLQRLFVASILIILVVIVEVETFGGSIPRTNPFKILAIGINEMESTGNLEVTNSLYMEEQYRAGDFDAVVLNAELANGYRPLIEETIDRGKTVIFYDKDASLEHIRNCRLASHVFQVSLEPEYEQGIKALFVSRVAGMPVLGTIAYPSHVVVGDTTMKTGMGTIDFEGEVSNTLMLLESLKQSFSPVTTEMETISGPDSPIDPLSSFGQPFLFLQDTPLYMNGVRVARNISLIYVTPTLNTSSYSQWDVTASAFFLPEQENVYLLKGTVKVGGDFPDQNIIDWTDLTSGSRPTLLYTSFPLLSEEAIDSGGYKISNYGKKPNEFEWTITKKLFGEPWSKAQMVSPAIRLLNYGGPVGITTSGYAEYWIGAGKDGFVLRTIDYQQKLEW